MGEQFPHYPEHQESLDDQADAGSDPPRPYADGWQHVHRIQRELFGRFEDDEGEKSREDFEDTTAPEKHGKPDLQDVGPEPEIVPKK